MPISKAQRKLYPPDWPAISMRIRAAAQGMPGMDLIVTDGQPLACGCRGHISVAEVVG